MWTQLASALFGIWLVVAPAALGYGGSLSTSDRIVGPLVATFALIAASEVMRSVRRVNLVLAGWVFVSPVALGRVEGAGHHFVVAIAVAALSSVRTPARHSCGGGWMSLLRGFRAPR
jgi:hypothetical protein